MLSDIQKQIIRSAHRHENNYLLERRYSRNWREPWSMSPLDLKYKACGDLVVKGIAGWLSGRSAPGIYLESKYRV